MLLLPPFQTLPIHIAEEIARYYIGLQRHHRRHGCYVAQSRDKAWLTLHNVSYYWMQLARRNIYGSVALYLSTDPVDVNVDLTLNTRFVIERRTSIIPHVKNIDIYFDDIVEEPNEENLKKLNLIWPEGLVFPNVRSLYFQMGCRLTKSSDNARNDRIFRWFMDRVRSSFPNLQETTIEFGEGGIVSVGPDVLFSKEWNASLFLSALFRTAFWDMGEDLYVSYMDNKHLIKQNAPAHITNFNYPDGCNYELSNWITKKSAQTLEMLRYCGEGSGSLKDVLFDDDGQVIVYPRLRDLCVFDCNDGKGELKTDKSIVPFPVLQHLRVYSNCIFKDDTLFRGSGKTLISLGIGLHRGFVDIFRKYKLFSQGAYPNILHISATHDIKSSLALPADEFAKAVFGLISAATQSMTINGGIAYQHIASIMPTSPYLKNIQILKCTSAILSLLEILGVFKYFPHMTDFECSFQGIDSDLGAIQDKLIPSHLGMQYSQLSSRLKCLHLCNSGPISCGDMAVLFVTLAVLCPDFTFVKELENNREEYDSKIGYILSSGLYDQHAKRLGRLFGS